jgi:hypothetical protein
MTTVAKSRCVATGSLFWMTIIAITIAKIAAVMSFTLRITVALDDCKVTHGTEETIDFRHAHETGVGERRRRISGTMKQSATVVKGSDKAEDFALENSG